MDMNRIARLGIGVLLLIVGISAFAGGNIVGGILLTAGGSYFLREYRREERQRQQEPITMSTSESRMERPAARTDQIYAHALRAVAAAGLNPDTVSVLPVDIGLLVYKDEDDPVVHRSQPINNDVDYIQPYIELRLPQKAVGLIRFEIVDSEGQTIFIHENNHELSRGRNLITPSARLPVHDAQAMEAGWQLWVSADGVPLAKHSFYWHEAQDNNIREYISEDGEISSEMRAALAENRLQRMSLDDLLSNQEPEQPTTARRTQRR